MTAESHPRATGKPFSAPFVAPSKHMVMTVTHNHTNSRPASTRHGGENNIASLGEIASFLALSSPGGLILSSPTDLSIPNHIKSQSVFKEFSKNQHYSVQLAEMIPLAHCISGKRGKKREHRRDSSLSFLVIMVRNFLKVGCFPPPFPQRSRKTKTPIRCRRLW